jgi:hypothetical protein
VTPRVALAVLGLLVSGSATGCASEATASSVQPACAEGEDGSASNGVVLMAQSVPTASFVPCLRTALPLGWSFHHLAARDGTASFWLNSDRDGQQAIEVRLDPSCDTAGATQIPSDREGMDRFERVRLTTPSFEGERYYVFAGGCLTVVFELTGEGRGEPLALATQAVGVLSREDLGAQVHEDSDGRLSLDPAGEGGE